MCKEQKRLRTSYLVHDAEYARARPLDDKDVHGTWTLTFKAVKENDENSVTFFLERKQLEAFATQLYFAMRADRALDRILTKIKEKT